MNAYLLCHLGLGDNLYMVGAVRFLLQYYKKIYFLCKDIYLNNVKLFYKNNDNVFIIPVNSKNEESSIKKIINQTVYQNNDVLIASFCHDIKSKITHPKLIHRIPEEKKYNLDHDTLTTENYSFIEIFYHNIKLDLNIFFEYFELPSSIKSQNHYNSLLEYKKIIFIHSKSSNGRRLDFMSVYKKNILRTDTIIICADHNIYEKTKNINKIAQEKKYKICNLLVNIPLIYYVDIIKNCHEIFITDSCFTGIVLPLLKTNKLKAKTVRIIERNTNIQV